MLVERVSSDTQAAVTTGGAIAALAFVYFSPIGDEHLAIMEGVVDVAHRGRRLGFALLVQALNDFATLGYERAAMDVDTQNPTGALRLYEKLGFEAFKRTIFFAK